MRLSQSIMRLKVPRVYNQSLIVARNCRLDILKFDVLVTKKRPGLRKISVEFKCALKVDYCLWTIVGERVVVACLVVLVKGGLIKNSGMMITLRCQ